MHITILGASRFGVATAQHLIDEGHEVVLIDRDRARLDELADELDCGMVCGDGTLPSTLRDAYGDGSDALVALTNEDDVNILAAVVGRAVGFDRVIPQIVRPELLTVVEELDLDDVITPHDSLAKSIVGSLTEHSEVDADLSLHRELRLVHHIVPQAFDGKTIGEIELPEGARAVAHSGRERENLAEDDVKLAKGDKLMFVTRKEATEKLTKIFRES